MMCWDAGWQEFPVNLAANRSLVCCGARVLGGSGELSAFQHMVCLGSDTWIHGPEVEECVYIHRQVS